MRYAMFLAGRTLEEKVAWAKKIEGAGFSSLWGAEFSNSPFIHLAAVAPHTQRIKIGTGVALAFVRGPLLTALATLDMDEVTQGRFIMGLGAGSKERNELWYSGSGQGQPVAQMREYIQLVRLLVEKVPTTGRSFLDTALLQRQSAFVRPSHGEAVKRCSRMSPRRWWIPSAR